MLADGGAEGRGDDVLIQRGRRIDHRVAKGATDIRSLTGKTDAAPHQPCSQT